MLFSFENLKATYFCMVYKQYMEDHLPLIFHEAQKQLDL